MPFSYRRRIRFRETDAAGVVYFANLLALCHEAYEVSLAEAGFDVARFFSRDSNVVVPVVHTEADFYQPLGCGDAIALHLTPTKLSPHSFEIRYDIYRHSEEAANIRTAKPAVKALTRHVCIHTQTRQRQVLTPQLVDWIRTIANQDTVGFDQTAGFNHTDSPG